MAYQYYRAQLKSDLNGVILAMENARNFGNGYPLTVHTSFTPSSGVTLAGGGSADGKTYCLKATSNNVTYTISPDNLTPSVDVCVITLAGSGVAGFATGPASVPNSIIPLVSRSTRLATSTSRIEATTVFENKVVKTRSWTFHSSR